MSIKTLYFSSLLDGSPESIKRLGELYDDGEQMSAKGLFEALKKHGVPYGFIDNTSDIWARDFMPVEIKSAEPENRKFVSFKYNPWYLKGLPYRRNDYKKEIQGQFPNLDLRYTGVILDGGNIVSSPSKNKVIISNRIMIENKCRTKKELAQKLTKILNAEEVIIIPSLPATLKKGGDMTGHADGMVRFIDENKVVCNDTGAKLERDITTILNKHGIEVIPFPFEECYINYLETEKYIFLPLFDIPYDDEAYNRAKKILLKPIVPVKGIAKLAEIGGGVLNCISWEL